MKTTVSVLLTAFVFQALVAGGGELGFDEDFALSDDRAEALKQLIPGTEDYYYYHCLHYQHTGKLDDVDTMLKQWIKRYGHSARVEEMRNRQAVLRYAKNPKASVDHIGDRLNLRFAHQKQQLDRTTQHPTALDPTLIRHDTLVKRAFSQYKNLAGFEDSALAFLAGAKLNADQRRDLLHRLKRPDIPGLPKLVVDDLKYRHSRGFGSHGIHRQLLLDQLDACRKLMPELSKDTNFINTYLAKLRPDADMNWRHDPQAKRAYLDRMWAFAGGLPPTQNSLKAHVLFRLLELDREEGTYDRDRFMAYLKLPRTVAYINRDYLNRPEHRSVRANLGANFQSYTLMPVVGLDEPLVRDYLQHFLLDAPNVNAFADYIESRYLKELFAETKIVNGVGDMEAWYSLLPPARYQALKERIDLEFRPTNPETFGVDQDVELKLAVKNVETLIIKTYEINTETYYREHLEAVSTAIDLDGLVANQERTVTYKQVPLRRHVETFAFPAITRPGVYVVEFIGNGRSSRALVRKGRLTYADRPDAAGHVFTVYNEALQQVKDAAIWIAGHTYTADADGEIAVPYSTRPGSQKMVITHNGFSVLESFQHASETYRLSAGFFADREALVEGLECRLLVRPELLLGGRPVSLDLLEQPKLTIRCKDREDIDTTVEVPGFKLTDGAEGLYTFRVPEKVTRLECTLSGRARSVTEDKDVDLSTGAVVPLNGIDATEKIEDLHFRHVAGGYVVELLGKSGEPRPDRAVNFEFKHRDFKRTVHAVLQTDDSGRIRLGPLPGIVTVTARGPEGTRHTWATVKDRRSYPATIHAAGGEPVRVPYMEGTGNDPDAIVSLLETRDGTFVRDAGDKVRADGGLLELVGLEPGDYDLYLKEDQVRILVRVARAKRIDGQLVGRDRTMHAGNTAPLQAEVGVAGDDTGTLQVQLQNVTADTRVHVLATRFVQDVDVFAALGGPTVPGLDARHCRRPVSQYLSGRNIGDEYRYILERRYAKKFPGNMLRRPGLLLNPWSLRKTETRRKEAEEGGAWEAADEELRDGQALKRLGGGRAGGIRAGVARGFASYDFLPETSLLLTNLKPDANGRVTLKLADLGPRQQVHVLALNAEHALYREVALGASAEAYRDRRLLKQLDVARHFAEQKQISTVAAGTPFVIEDMMTSRLEVYDSLASVYSLFSTLSGDATLAEFGFILDWPGLEPARKRELYTKYACHELNFFLYRKDPAFFAEAVQPYLRNKKDKTFLDIWLTDADLSAYREAWRYGRLNIVERILLGRTLNDPATARHVKDLYDLLPPDIERYNYLFKTALKSGALGASDDAEGMEDAFAEAAPGGNALRKSGALRGVVAAPMSAAKPMAPALAMQAERLEEAAPFGEKKAVAMDALVDRSPAGRNRADKAKAESRRRSLRRLYRKLETTKEWVENNYYHLPIEQQLAELVTANAFWRDYAAYDGKGPFLSPNVAEACRSFTEMMLALAVLDLPFKAPEHEKTYEQASLRLVPGGPAIIYHKEIQEAEAADTPVPLLVSQNYFAQNDRYRHEDNQRFDKFVVEEFQARRVYGCQVVLTNPTSTPREVDVLLQVPGGAIPVLNGFYTTSKHMRLEPYGTMTVEYYYYFPVAGAYMQYPVHVAQNGRRVANADPFELNVVDKLTKIDTTSWPYVSQNGAPDAVIAYLRDNNIDRLDLNLIAFRMRDKAFYGRVMEVLQARHVYHDTLWSYGVYHADTPVAREYLQHTRFANACGLWIDSPLLTVNPVPRHSYQHKEYWPFVNARTYQLGARRTILNDQLFAQYSRFLAWLRYRPALDDADRGAVVYYLLLQDRIDEALAVFDRIDRDAMGAALQYDYMEAYLALYREDVAAARKLAVAYHDYPVDRWRKLFEDVLVQVDEIEGREGGAVVDADSRDQVQAKLAATEPALDFKVENRKLEISYRNVTSCRIHYYLMDVELLFSRNPFVQKVSGQFSVIRPNHVQTVDLPARREATTVDLPREYRDSNVMIEITAGGVVRTQAYYPHSLNLQITENYGQLRVAHAATGRALSKVYVKVYARLSDGSIRFYKDGYTDLRGRFDYTSLSTDELDKVQRFSLLIMDEKHGAVVREAAPPKR